MTPIANASWIWASSTSEARALQKGSNSFDRIAACWYAWTSFNIDLAFNDSNTHQVALYLLDWDIFGGGRTERADILDANGNVLDTRAVSGFVNKPHPGNLWATQGNCEDRLRACSRAFSQQNGTRLGRPAIAAIHAAEIGKLVRPGVSKSEIARRLVDFQHRSTEAAYPPPHLEIHVIAGFPRGS